MVHRILKVNGNVTGKQEIFYKIKTYQKTGESKTSRYMYVYIQVIVDMYLEGLD